MRFMDDAVPRSLFLIFLILAGGFFSGAETALSFCNRIRMQVLADAGDKRAQRAVWILEQFERAVVTLLIASASLLEKTISSFREAEKIFADTTMQMRPMLKCLGIAAASRLGADLCRDASQAALASAVELAGTLCAVAVSMPMIFTMLTTIGGLL